MIQSAQISLDIENLDFAFNCDIEVFIWTIIWRATLGLLVLGLRSLLELGPGINSNSLCRNFYDWA